MLKNAAVSNWSVWILHLLCTKIGLNHGDRVRARVLAKGFLGDWIEFEA